VAFSAFKNGAERNSLNRERTQRKNQEPMGQWQYVNAVFTASNTDLIINHSLLSVDPEAIRYLVVRQSKGAVVFQDLSTSRTPWSTGVIRLRASATTSARILLFTESPNSAPPAATVG
jgi:hypothetical protein